MGDKFFGAASSDFARDAYLSSGEAVEADLATLTLGPYTTASLLGDPKRFGFFMARHKFVAKMLTGLEAVFEVGCQEGLGALIVSKAVGRIVATDFYKPHIDWCAAHMTHIVPTATFAGHDIVAAPVPGGPFDGGYSMDVFEHIDPAQADRYMENVSAALKPHGVFICGIPSLESQAYASPASKAGHINCRSGEDMRALFRRYFHNVFLFGMNDEMVHTGFAPMCQYLITLGVGPKAVG